MTQEERVLGVGLSLKHDIPALRQAIRFGVGAQQIRMRVVVDQVAPSSSADKAGILPGDCLVAVGDQPVEDMTPDAVMALIVGPVGTSVSLALERFDGNGTVSFTRILVRAPREAMAGSPTPFRRKRECKRCPDLHCPGCPRAF
jgi:C-terminal processing protease CtpA/Prc